MERQRSAPPAAALGFPPLPELAGWDHRDEALQRVWRGPSARSNWLVPGRVLCSDMPYTLSRAEGRSGVAACGVSTVVCLRTKAEMRQGPGYEAALRKLRGDMKFVHFPITDQEVADDGLVEYLVDQLLERLRGGENLLIHCNGGHGRTGTISALLLGRLYGLAADEALRWYQRLHDMRASPIFAGSTDDCIAAALFQHGCPHLTVPTFLVPGAADGARLRRGRRAIRPRP